jgi:DNA-binding GntR family transcriptional regulator
VLIHDIVTGQIALGDRLINRELQTRFGVSSTPIRDAINKLYQDGLIRELTNSGAQLIDFDQQYAEELNHFIMMLACEALALAAQSDQQAEIVRLLHEYQDAMESSQENDTEYFGADYRFHKVFFDYCGNRFLKETYKRYNRIRSLLISSAMRASRWTSTGGSPLPLKRDSLTWPGNRCGSTISTACICFLTGRTMRNKKRPVFSMGKTGLF